MRQRENNALPPHNRINFLLYFLVASYITELSTPYGAPGQSTSLQKLCEYCIRWQEENYYIIIRLKVGKKEDRVSRNIVSHSHGKYMGYSILNQPGSDPLHLRFACGLCSTYTLLRHIHSIEFILYEERVLLFILYKLKAL